MVVLWMLVKWVNEKDKMSVEPLASVRDEKLRSLSRDDLVGQVCEIMWRKKACVGKIIRIGNVIICTLSIHSYKPLLGTLPLTFLGPDKPLLEKERDEMIIEAKERKKAASKRKSNL